MTDYAPLVSQHVLTHADPQQNSGADTPKEGISSLFETTQNGNPNRLNRN